MRLVVKRIEIGEEKINIVYKVNQLPSNEFEINLQHCCNRRFGSVGSRGQQLPLTRYYRPQPYQDLHPHNMVLIQQ